MAVLAVLIYILVVGRRVDSAINDIQPITRKVGQFADFLWNATVTPIMASQWGLRDPSGNNPPKPLFISAMITSKNVIFGNDLDTIASSYKNRVHFIGNLSIGRAWFRLTDLKTSDANQYRATIQESGQPSFPFTVTLTVLPAETTTTAAPSTTPSSTSTRVPRTSPPVLDSDSFKVKKVCSGEKTKIECPTTGSPPPRYSWYNPFNKSVGGKNGVENEIEVDPIQGNWTCHVTNGVGPDVYCIVEIKVLPKDHVECKKGVECNLSTGQMVGIVIGVLLAVIIIAVIIVVIYKKMKSGEGLSTKEMVAIITGMLVAVGIIVAIAVAIHTKNDQCLSTGALVGIIIGVLVVVVGIIVAIVVTMKKKKNG